MRGPARGVAYACVVGAVGWSRGTAMCFPPSPQGRRHDSAMVAGGGDGGCGGPVNPRLVLRVREGQKPPFRHSYAPEGFGSPLPPPPPGCSHPQACQQAESSGSHHDGSRVSPQGTGPALCTGEASTGQELPHLCSGKPPEVGV